MGVGIRKSDEIGRLRDMWVRLYKTMLEDRRLASIGLRKRDTFDVECKKMDLVRHPIIPN